MRCSWGLAKGLAFALFIASGTCKSNAEPPRMEVERSVSGNMFSQATVLIVQSRDDREFKIQGVKLNRGNIKPIWMSFVDDYEIKKNPNIVASEISLVAEDVWLHLPVDLTSSQNQEICAGKANAKIVEVGKVVKPTTINNRPVAGHSILICVVEPILRFGQSYRISSATHFRIDAQVLEAEIITDRGSRVFTFR